MPRSFRLQQTILAGREASWHRVVQATCQVETAGLARMSIRRRNWCSRLSKEDGKTWLGSGKRAGCVKVSGTWQAALVFEN